MNGFGYTQLATTTKQARTTILPLAAAATSDDDDTMPSTHVLYMWCRNRNYTTGRIKRTTGAGGLVVGCGQRGRPILCISVGVAYLH